jgi:hypothetical protein
MADMAREGNPQGLLPTLTAIEANPQRWQKVLSEEARNCIGVLRERLSATWALEQERAAEWTKDAPLDPAKVAEFRNELVRSFAESGRLRHILKAKGALDVDLNKSPGAPVQSLGFSQIDDKNAFIAQEHTSYVGWGRNYGQGIAQGEDEETFAAMIAAAKAKQSIVPGAVFAAIETAINNAALKDPIVLHTLEFDVQYAQIEGSAAFTPKYAPGLDTPWRDFNGFMGLLSIGTREIPVFDVFVQRPTSNNHILVLDARRFFRWHQFAPDRDPNEQTYAEGQLLIRVVDLNADSEERGKIIAQNPPWLAEEANPTEYLRGRVLVNVYEKFHLEILDASQCACLVVPQ